jgi:lysophospholipid acyltransferase (LPLAT)-like uncharacterized protein
VFDYIHRVKNQFWQRVAAALIYIYMIITGKTSRVILKPGIETGPLRKNDHKTIFALWHNRIFFFCYYFRGTGTAIPISLHKDGKLIADVALKLGYRVISGSTSRGSVKVLSSMISVLEQDRFLAITPDGPRGPKYSIQDGLFYAALKTGAPIIGAAWSAKYVKIFNSWDRFVLPLPFNTFYVTTTPEIRVCSKEEIPEKKALLKQYMDGITDEAEKYFKA